MRINFGRLNITKSTFSEAMAASEKVDLEMRRISGKLNAHFAFLNADRAAADGTKISCLHCKKQFAYDISWFKQTRR